jgi:hypothetical protein
MGRKKKTKTTIVPNYPLNIDSIPFPTIPSTDSIQSLNHLVIRVPKDDCCICFESFEKKNLIITQCNHIFHLSCLLKNLIKSNLCPLCRSEIELKRESPRTVYINNLDQQQNNQISNYVSFRLFDYYLITPFLLFTISKTVYDYFPFSMYIFGMLMLMTLTTGVAYHTGP